MSPAQVIALWCKCGGVCGSGGGCGGREGRNGNGAGIAADPTLTGVWTSPQRELCLTPGASPQAGCGTLARRSRRCRSAGGWGWCRHRSLAVPAVRDRGRGSCHLERLRLCQGALALPSVAGPCAIRPFASGNDQCDALCFVGFTPCGCYPLSYRRRIVLHLRVSTLPGVPLRRIARAFLGLGSAFRVSM